jgi:hypothetical protein
MTFETFKIVCTYFKAIYFGSNIVFLDIVLLLTFYMQGTTCTNHSTFHVPTNLFFSEKELRAHLGKVLTVPGDIGNVTPGQSEDVILTVIHSLEVFFINLDSHILILDSNGYRVTSKKIRTTINC